MNWLAIYVEASVLGICLLIIAYFAACVAMSRASLWAAVAKSLGVIAWFVAVFELAHTGIFEGSQPGARMYILLALGVPLVIGGLWSLTDNARDFVAELPTGSIAAILAVRLNGVVFLIALLNDSVPTWLGLWAGLHEMFVGVISPVMALAAARGDRRVFSVGRVVNITCILHTTAIGVTAAWLCDGAGFFMTVHPLVLYTVFVMPASIVLHLLSLTKIRLTRQIV
ncbi:MAG TPA: hypothetical protein VGI83_00665 [Gemmatimonadales bacterium]|jgi:hypothetical protein